MERYVCIHGHFYQPPRENPWLEAIELQDSAYPYHDWNERVTAEAYAPNARARILDPQGRISEIVNNYSRISFNLGPTLMAWMEGNAREVYDAVIQADRESRPRFSGHGSAMAQAYGHLIMPLANARDKRTQVKWGIEDFVRRFGRKPEGMWLPETAVDLDTLEALAEAGVAFTVLAPHQARRIRRIGDAMWREAVGGLDTTTAYSTTLPSGRRMALFFYDGPASRAVAFEGLLSSGERFAQRLLSGFNDGRSWPQLVNIATDGETYGHHHRFGDMALAYALRNIEANRLARLTNYGEYLERCPPAHEVEIAENTSWSCAHGVERWRADCGCSTGGRPGWNQRWRAPLREALDWLRDAVALPFESIGRKYFKDPWAARDAYVSVVLDRSRANADRFLREQTGRPLSAAEETTALKLMEIQRNAMLMYTSCGWFFSDLAGIETVQVLHYAARVIQLAQELFDAPLEPRFLALLERARSNQPEQGDGRAIYDRLVRPSMVDLPKVGAHYALSSLFEDYARRTSIYCYTVERDAYEMMESGRARLAVGRVRVRCEVTRESGVFSFGVLHLGDHNVVGGVRAYSGEEAYRAMLEEVGDEFDRAEFPEVIRQLDKHVGEFAYSLRTLFRDEQRKLVQVVLRSTLDDVESMYRQIHRNYSPLMRFLVNINVPLPKALEAAVEFVVNQDLRRAFEADASDVQRMRAMLQIEELDHGKLHLDAEGLGFTLKRTLRELAERFRASPEDMALLQRFRDTATLARSLPFEVDLWSAQNVFYDILREAYPSHLVNARAADPVAQQWVRLFTELGQTLRVRVPA